MKMLTTEDTEVKGGKLELEILSGRIIGAAMKVHSVLGPGLLESTYEICLTHELKKVGLKSETQVVVPVYYDNIRIDIGYRIDLLVENTIIVELKAVESLLPIHQAQLMSYLKLSQKRLGLLINFNSVYLRDGIKRIIL
jgi:GxxExxY protein